MLALSDAIDDLRKRFGVPRGYRFKMSPGPVGMSHDQFIALKAEALRTAAQHGAKLLVYVVLHDISTNPDEARRNGINTLSYHFDCILNRYDTPGLVLIDRFNDKGNAIEAHLRDKFSIGATDMPFSKEYRLKRIVGFHYSAIGQSHLPSLVDIALGSLRFAINAHTRAENHNRRTALMLLNLLAPLFWREREDGPVPELGFLFSPKSIRKEAYRKRYESLKAFLAEGGVVTSQPITSERPS